MQEIVRYSKKTPRPSAIEVGETLMKSLGAPPLVPRSHEAFVAVICAARRCWAGVGLRGREKSRLTIDRLRKTIEWFGSLASWF